MRILLVEDHPSLGPDLKRSLERCHYAVDLSIDGDDAVHLALVFPYDLIILDILLPGLNGFEVCRQLRTRQSNVPILFLTALEGVDDRVQGLDLGADDYVTKPFDFRELEARIRALLRRESTPKNTVLKFMDITMDTSTHEVRRGQRLIRLSSKEYTLLDFLMRRPREVLSRTTIAEHVWDYDAEHLSNVIDVYVGYVRTKLCADGEPNVIQSVRGIGYQLKEPER
ncbi:response regulator transcription factor [Ktedonosporobacter rubrisoli]|uniref:Response regulator transcription factor n=1 Tax=Ktedonosporobacter rubrisoli TaxID=2509675 RepID=A0A4P6JN37_KTERU|nr:response regulator transcription factor [Ktedonosporobacter rubrisoli]QBD76708.1 response regulator transcription factor [Ktedonosporobacter rubrisoli]